MRVATIRSSCECQAKLGAELDESLHVRRAWALDPRRRVEENAPAQALRASGGRFDVGWSCPFCIRNTLRSFDVGGLAWEERILRSEAPAG